MFLALLGVAAARFRASPGAIWFALGLLVLWQVLELVPRSVDVIAASGSWGVAWAAATDPGERAAASAALAAWDGIWSALGVVRRIVWGSTHLAFGLAFIRGNRLESGVAALFLFNALRLLPRTVSAILGWEAGAGLLAETIWFQLGMVALFVAISAWLVQQILLHRHAIPA